MVIAGMIPQTNHEAIVSTSEPASDVAPSPLVVLSAEPILPAFEVIILDLIFSTAQISLWFFLPCFCPDNVMTQTMSFRGTAAAGWRKGGKKKKKKEKGKTRSPHQLGCLHGGTLQ